MNDIQTLLTEAVAKFGSNSDRSLQTTLGPSSIGFCRQQAALITKGVPKSDVKSMWSAQVGTAVHDYLRAAAEAAHPEWITERKVTCTLPNGAEITGTLDLIIGNALIDHKTVDGFEWVRREGSSMNHKMQRHIYAMGAEQEGLLVDDGTMMVGNCYWDRSGKEKEPLLILEPFDVMLTDQITSWVDDVIYAVQHGEDASRDIPAAVCAQICEFFSVCRGNLPVEEGGESITDADSIAAVRMYVDGAALGKTADAMKREAKARLVDRNGIAYLDDKPFQVRWVHTNETEVAGFMRAASDRIDVKALKNG